MFFAPAHPSATNAAVYTALFALLLLPKCLVSLIHHCPCLPTGSPVYCLVKSLHRSLHFRTRPSACAHLVALLWMLGCAAVTESLTRTNANLKSPLASNRNTFNSKVTAPATSALIVNSRLRCVAFNLQQQRENYDQFGL